MSLTNMLSAIPQSPFKLCGVAAGFTALSKLSKWVGNYEAYFVTAQKL